jgi:hypothetical protein
MELLDLSKVVERDTITLKDGKTYELVNPDDLGIYEYARITQLQEESCTLEATAKKGKLTPKNERELLRILGEFVKLLIPTIKPAGLGKLTQQDRERIILVWMGRHMTGEEPAGEASSRRSGAPSSRGSKRSTAATRARGSRSRSGS